MGDLRARWRRWTRWKRIALTALVVAVLAAGLPAGAAAIALRIEYAGDPAEHTRTRGRDAVWLGHAWVDGRKTEADVEALARQIAGTGIRDLYVHTGPLERDGSLLASRYPQADRFLTAVRRTMPGVRIQAWLGSVVRPQQGGLDLEDRLSRDRIVWSSARVLDRGFDGVHFDLEPVRSGSPGFLALLDQVRELTKARKVVLSIAAPQIAPVPGLNRVVMAISGHPKWWSKGYFAAAARRVDQIAVMSYDTWTAGESLYGGMVARQTELALEVTPDRVDLLMGLPAYWEPDHFANVETVPAAVRGARLALGRHAPQRQAFGLALYVDFTATPADWDAYRSDWC
jgi:hypothetical protein